MIKKIKEFWSRLKLIYKLFYVLQLYKKTCEVDPDYELNCKIIERIKSNASFLSKSEICDIIKEYEIKTRS